MAANILLTRVSGRPEFQKYCLGRAKWHEVYRSSPSEAQRLFREVVDQIIHDFAPRLLRLRRRKRLVLKTEASKEAKVLPELSYDFIRPTVAKVTKLLVLESRPAVEARYDLVSIREPTTVQGLEDMGTSRASVAVYTLYNYVLSSYRFPSEPTKKFDHDLFARTIRQYPRLQLSDVVSLLLLSRIVTQIRVSSHCDEDYRMVNTNRLKLTSRFEQWGNYELIIQVKHIKELREQLTIAMGRLLIPPSPPESKHSETVMEQESTEQNPVLLEHSFSTPTNGGTVACFLELMLFGEVVDLKMCINLSDITFMGDKLMNSAVDSYYEKQSKARPGDKVKSSGAIGTVSKSGFPRKDASGKLLVNRSFLSQLHQSPACFADMNFWIESGYNRRARWFDHRLSFSGGRIVAFHWPHIDKTVEPEASLENWYAQMNNQVNLMVDRAVNLGPKPLIEDSEEHNPVDADQSSSGPATLALPSDVLNSVDFKLNLEKFIMHGRITGRTSVEISAKFPDKSMTAMVLRDLITEERVYWVGSTVSRFVHRRHIRLWMIHVKAAPLKSNPRINELNNACARPNETGYGTEWDADMDGDGCEARPAKRRRRISSQSTHTERSLNQPHGGKTNVQESNPGLFIPEQWLSENGFPKPRAFCGFLQAILSQLVPSAGTTLKRFAPQYQLFYGEQAVRRLLFWLRDLGAVKILRIVQEPKASLFSPTPTYTVSDELELASADELTLVPTAHCLSIVGSFCDQYLTRVGDNLQSVWTDRSQTTSNHCEPLVADSFSPPNG